ncbi:MAG: hypothetical protein HY378_00580 [Candidatus Brennerbacteria bacterium]|nr:hypothetical protein [Candidatus Brennerbacteria bacterium]
MIIIKERVLAVFAVLSLLFLLSGLVLVYFNIADLASPLVLRFDNILGSDFFGEKESLWLVWAAGFFIILINFFIGHALFFRERVLSYLVFGATALFSLLHFVAITQIISLN